MNYKKHKIEKSCLFYQEKGFYMSLN